MRSALVLGVVVILASPVEAAGVRVSLPQGMAAEVAGELLRQLVANTRHTYEVDGAQVTFAPGRSEIGFSVPTQVSESGTSRVKLPWGGNLAGSSITMTVDVRCCVIVSYELERIRVEDGALLLPEARVLAVYVDPPGQRGRFRYSCGALRNDWILWDTSAIEMLKGRLAEEALTTARKEYIEDRHAELEKRFARELADKLAELARKR
jgi:hypothetical protein